MAIHQTTAGAARDLHTTPHLPSSLADRTATGRSAQTRAVHPEAAEPHPRAADLCESMREIIGAEGGVTETELIGAGFPLAELIEHMPEARRLLRAGWVRQLAPAFDRVPDIIEKALASAAHHMPRMAGPEPIDGAAEAWGRYCAARAAWKIDRWIGQQERCVALLDAFLGKATPLLPREKNRVLYAIAADMKAVRARGNA